MTNDKRKNDRCCEVEQADGRGGNSYHRFLKRRKNRIERKRAKQNPDCVPGYGRYSGYET